MIRILKSLPDGLLNGLPPEDQAAILARIGQPVTVVETEFDRLSSYSLADLIDQGRSGLVEIEWIAADRKVAEQMTVARRVMERSAPLLIALAKQ